MGGSLQGGRVAFAHRCPDGAQTPREAIEQDLSAFLHQLLVAIE
jgi:hypothetical protein